MGTLLFSPHFRVVTESFFSLEDPVSRPLLRCLVTPLVASPFESDVLKVLSINGLAVATAPATA